MSSLPLSEVLKNHKTFIVTAPSCTRCEEAREVLNRHKIKYEEYNCVENELLSDDIRKEYSHSTFPQIFIDGKFIGGSDELKKHFNEQ